jgi:hypothetical protein
MGFELAMEDFMNVFLQAEWVANQSLDVALVHEESSLFFASGVGRHFVE